MNKMTVNGKMKEHFEKPSILKKIIGWLIMLVTILPILTFLGGKNRSYVIATEDIKRIPFIESEVKILQDETLTLKISQGQTNKSIEKIDHNIEIIQMDIKQLLTRNTR